MIRLIIAFVALAISGIAYADKYIHGHTNKNGMYTQGHVRSAPNSKRYDNLNSKTTGTNPYTGKKGDKHDEFSNLPVSNQGRQKK
jgi:hypothetical protein